MLVQQLQCLDSFLALPENMGYTVYHSYIWWAPGNSTQATLPNSTRVTTASAKPNKNNLQDSIKPTIFQSTHNPTEENLFIYLKRLVIPQAQFFIGGGWLMVGTYKVVVWRIPIRLVQKLTPTHVNKLLYMILGLS